MSWVPVQTTDNGFDIQNELRFVESNCPNNYGTIITGVLTERINLKQTKEMVLL